MSVRRKERGREGACYLWTGTGGYRGRTGMAEQGFHVSRDSTVREMRRFLGSRAAETVTPETRTVEAVRRFCRHRDINTLAVVDESNRLVGILEVGRLVDDILADVLPEGYMRDSLDREKMLEATFLLTVHETVGQMMTEPVAVTYEDTAEEAFMKLHSNRLRGVPIVDAEGRVRSYLGLLEFLTLWMPGTEDEMRIHPEAEEG